MPAAITALRPVFTKILSDPDAPAWVRRCRRLLDELFDPYRPELHYMRGPGPKWRQKHGLPV